MEAAARLLWLFAIVLTLVGLWYSATGMRVVVSGRIDERRRSAGSLKWGLPMVAAGVLLWIAATWLWNWSQVP